MNIKRNIIALIALLLIVGATTHAADKPTNIPHSDTLLQRFDTLIIGDHDTIRIIATNSNVTVYNSATIDEILDSIFVDSSRNTIRFSKRSIKPGKTKWLDVIEVSDTAENTFETDSNDTLTKQNPRPKTPGSMKRKVIRRRGNEVVIYDNGQRQKVNAKAETTQTNPRTPQDSKKQERDDESMLESFIDQATKDYWRHKRNRGFSGHWAGVEWGFGWFMSPTGSLRLDDEYEPYRLKMGRSFNVNLNLLQKSFDFGTPNAGLLVGLGFSFHDYHFSGKATPVANNREVLLDSSLYLESGYISRNSFFMSYLTVPLLIEYQTHGRRWERFFMSAGVIGGVRLGAHTRVSYDKGRKYKLKDGFYLNELRYAVTLRGGVGPLKLYVNFYPQGLFEHNRGPKMFPIDIGLILLNF